MLVCWFVLFPKHRLRDGVLTSVVVIGFEFQDLLSWPTCLDLPRLAVKLKNTHCQPALRAKRLLTSGLVASMPQPVGLSFEVAYEILYVKLKNTHSPNKGLSLRSPCGVLTKLPSCLLPPSLPSNAPRQVPAIRGPSAGHPAAGVPASSQPRLHSLDCIDCIA